MSNKLKGGAAILALVLVGLIWKAPLGPVPGFFIGGNASAIPTNWGDTSKQFEVTFEVNNGLLPKVVTIWFVEINGLLHVVGGDKSSGWVRNLGTGGAVRLRLEDKTYEMSAELVTDQQEPILQAYQNKYIADYPDIVGSFPTLDEASESVAVYRLIAR
jgi:hypothetical protein